MAGHYDRMRRRVLDPTSEHGVVVAVSTQGLPSVLVGARDYPYENLGIIGGGLPVVGDEGEVVFGAPNRRLPMWWGRTDHGESDASSSTATLSTWPRMMQDLGRQGKSPWSSIPGLIAVTAVQGVVGNPRSLTTNPMTIARASEGLLYLCGQDAGASNAITIWAYTFSGNYSAKALELNPLHIIYSSAKEVLYVLNSNGVLYALKAFPTGDNLRQGILTGSTFTGVTLEPLEIGSALWLVDSHDWKSWTLKSLDVSNLSTVLTSRTMEWDGWGQWEGLPHCGTNIGDPIMPVGWPYFCPRLAVMPGKFACFVNAAGNVIPCGTDSEFRTGIQEFTENPPSQTGRNLGNIQERSQILCYNVLTGSRAWEHNGWQDRLKPTGFTPIAIANGKIVAHFERNTFASQTFRHLTNPADMQTSLTEYETQNRCWNQTTRVQTWNANATPMPRYAWDPLYELAGQVTERVQYVKPTFSTELTRDYQKAMTHGFVALNALTGEKLKELELSAPDKAGAQKVYADTGDPALHYVDPIFGGFSPKLMATGECRLLTATRAGNSTPIGQLFKLEPDEYLASYIAVEKYSGDTWTCDDGGVRSVFYQGYQRVLQTVTASGQTAWNTITPIWNDYTDPEGRWSQRTISVDYTAWAVRAKPVSCSVADLREGWDSYNAVSDGDQIFLLPRYMTPVERVNRVIWWPPGTVIGDNGYPAVVTDRGTSMNNLPFSQYIYYWAWANSATVVGERPYKVRLLTKFSHQYSDGMGLGATWLYYDFSRKRWGVPINYSDYMMFYLESDYYGSKRMYITDSNRPYLWQSDQTPLDPVNSSPGTNYNGPPPWTQSFYESWPSGDADGASYPDFNPGSGYNPYTKDSPTRSDSLRLPLASEIDATVVAMNASNLGWRWKRSFGVINHKCRPTAVVWGDYLFLWMAGTVYQLSKANGKTVRTMPLAGTESWTSAELTAMSGTLVLSGSGGVRLVT